MIPCKECITLAACMNKTQINCSILHDWILQEGNRISDNVYDLFKCASIIYSTHKGNSKIVFRGSRQ